MSLAYVNQSQHHENKSLQQNDQDMEDCPSRASEHVAHKTKHVQIQIEGPHTSQEGDQQKD